MTFIDPYVLLCFVLHIVSKGNTNKWNHNTVNNLISPNTISQNDEKPHTAELDMILQYHTQKLKLLKYCMKKSSVPQYRNLNPHAPPSRFVCFLFWLSTYPTCEPLGGTPLFKLYRYVMLHQAGFLHHFGLKTGIQFAHSGLESGMVFDRTTEVY